MDRSAPSSGCSLAESRVTIFPGLPDASWNEQLAPEADERRSIEPGPQLFAGCRLAQDGLVHPSQQRRAVQVDAPVRLPEQAVRQLDHPTGRTAQVAEIGHGYRVPTG